MIKKYLGFVGLFVLCACSAVDNTEKMKNITEEMNKRTQDLDAKTANLEYMQRQLLQMARQGGTQEQRREALKVMMSDLPVQNKFVQSAIYFRAFEFQLFDEGLDAWGGDVDWYYRDILTGAAAEELMVTLQGIINGPRPKPDPLKAESQMMTLFALSATMDQINDIQIVASNKWDFKPYSLYELMVQALYQKSAIERNGGVGPLYATKFLTYEDYCIYLLELRYNIYAAMLLDKIYDVSQMSLNDKLKLLMKSKLNVDLTSLNTPELLEINSRYIANAIDARNVLKQLGLKPKMNESVLAILKKASIKDDPNAQPGKAAESQKFKDGLKDLVCENGPCSSRDRKKVSPLKLLVKTIL